VGIELEGSLAALQHLLDELERNLRAGNMDQRVYREEPSFQARILTFELAIYGATEFAIRGSLLLSGETMRAIPRLGRGYGSWMHVWPMVDDAPRCWLDPRQVASMADEYLTRALLLSER
jgi:hypothetical protein